MADENSKPQYTTQPQVEVIKTNTYKAKSGQAQYTAPQYSGPSPLTKVVARSAVQLIAGPLILIGLFFGFCFLLVVWAFFH